MRVAILGSYPSWPFRKELDLRRDTRHVTTTWNVNLCRGLARLGIDTHVITLVAGIPESRTISHSDNLTLHFIAMDRWKKGVDLLFDLRWSQSLIDRRVAEIGPDLVHGIGTEHPYALVATRTAYPQVVTVHGVMRGVVEAMQPAPWSRYRFFARYETRAVSQATDIIVINPYVEARLGQLVEGKRIHRIENPIDPLFFQVPLEKERRGIVFVGMIQPRKGLDILVDALSGLPASLRPDRVRVVGPVVPQFRDYAEAVKIRAQEEGVSIDWVGAKEQEDLAMELTTARALVLPSREETAPMVIAEALATGTPVVATRVGGVEHMVCPEETGLLVAPEDSEGLGAALMQLEEAGPSAPCASAREEAERRYHPDAVAVATRDVYQRVLEGHG